MPASSSLYIYRPLAAPSCNTSSLLQVHRDISALPALKCRLFVDDVSRMLPTHGAHTVSIPEPNRFGGVDYSDDRRCLVPLAAAEEVGYAPKPSGAAPATRESAGNGWPGLADEVRVGERRLLRACELRKGYHSHGFAILWRKIGAALAMHDSAVSMLVHTDSERQQGREGGGVG